MDIVILNWNGWRDTLGCLESVFRLDYPDFRVLLCDNASTDGSVQRIIEWARARAISHGELSRAEAEQGGSNPDALDTARLVIIHTGANLGFAGGNNVALRYLIASGATGLVWLLNNDTVVAADSLQRMVTTLEAGNGLGCVGATLLKHDTPDIVETVGGGCCVPWQGMPRPTTASGQRRGSPDAIPRRLDFISCGCMVMPVPVVESIGLIDERYFMYCEDIDYSWRILAAGWKLGYAREAEVWHKGGGTTVYRSPRHDYYLARSALLLVHKFNPALLPLAMAFSLYRCVLPKVVRLQGARLRAVARAYRDFVRWAWFGETKAAWDQPGSPASLEAA